MHTKHTAIIGTLIVVCILALQAFAQDARPSLSELIQQARGFPIEPVTELPPAQKSTIESILEKPGIPVLSTGGTVYVLSNSVTAADIQNKLGLTDSAAARLATAARSNMSRRGGVFLVGTGATLALIQVLDDGSSVVIHQERPWWREYRWIIAIALGVIAILIFVILQKTGTIFKSQ